MRGPGSRKGRSIARATKKAARAHPAPRRQIRAPQRQPFGRRVNFSRRFETLEDRLVMAVLINEFVALNTSGIVDQNNDHSDWIELRNTGASAVNLNGWYLTNDSNSPTKWQLPSVSIAAGGYLTVFASGKDRHVAGLELHTNFTLDDSGGYLALLMPNQTVSYAYNPYPAQLENISYGLGTAATTQEFLLDEEAPAKVKVPTTAADDATWKGVSFNDASWLGGNVGIGYDDQASPIDFSPYINFNVGASMKRSGAAPGYAAYLRMPFQLANKDELTSLNLQMRYDDGFVAYLNGTEIARRNFTGSPIYTSSTGSTTHADTAAILYESIDVSAFLSSLQNGNNVLAIAGLNSTNSSDFLIDPLFTTTRASTTSVGFMATPSPGALNNTSSLGFVGDTHFSVDRGYYTNPFDVTITSDTAGAQIRYTLDGSAPTATTGLVYTGPIHVTTTTNLRAAAFKAGYTPSDVDTQTYLFLNDVIHQTGAGLPPTATWGQAGPDWAMDPDIVNSPTYSGQIIDALKAIPTMSISMNWADMFGSGGQGIYIAGSGVPKATSTEYFTADGQQFQINDSIQIQGGTSDDRWKQDKLSFRLKFTDDFGDTKLDFPLFTDPTFDQGATHSFNTLLLDAESNNVWTHPDPTQQGRATYVQDQYVADLQNLAGGYAPHGSYVQLYINGVYWGVYYLHERPDDRFASDYLGGDNEDYDILKHTATTPVNSSTTAVPDYAAFLTNVRKDMSVTANYQAVVNQLDTKNLIDYMIINFYTGNTDWSTTTAVHNWYASYNKASGAGKWRYHSWDAEHVLENVNDNITTRSYETGSPFEVFQRLMVNPEFKLQFADEAQRLMTNGGLLTPAQASSIFGQRAAQLNLAIIGESARWGDNRNTSTPYTAAQRNANVVSLQNNYFPFRTQVVLNQFAAQGWLSAVTAPNYSQYGGTVSAGTQITLSKAAGAPGAAEIYWTTDGSDPRTSISHSTGPAIVTINNALHLKARVLSGGVWSAMVDSVFLLTQQYPVRITELNYHPQDRSGVADADDMEWLELLNTGTQTVDLNGVKIESGITYTFTSSLMLAPGQRIVIARNRTVFQQVYGNSVNLAPGNYSGKLANEGEGLLLRGPVGEVLQDFAYSDSGDWPGRADGKGSTLEIIDPLGDPKSAGNWRPSSEYAGTPGTAGVGPVNRVIINEVLTHTDLPQVDAIELYNPTAAPINIGGWYLSDSSTNYKKYQIPAGTIIAAGQYLVFTEAQFNASPPVGSNVAFSLSSEGESVYLLSPGTGLQPFNSFEDRVEFGAAINGESFGRWPNATGELYPMKSVTLGAANSGPRIGPVVITEIMYNPTAGNPDLEFVELTNITNQPVALSATYPGVGNASWKFDGITFNLPAGTTIPANGKLVVVHFDPTLPADAAKLSAFRAEYGIGPEVTLVGPFVGVLDNAGEKLQLLRPDAPDPLTPTVVPYVLIDEVDYKNGAPWPTTNQATKQSLTRWIAALYGDEPTNWNAAVANPGSSDLYAPRVTGVYVNGTGWSQAYRDYLAGLGLGSSQFGFALPTGLNQATALTYANINRISIQFDENVTITQANLDLTGALGGSIGFSGFSYDSITHTATWSLATPLAADQLQLALANSVTDPANHPVDGEWVNNSSTFASGDGLPGGDFSFAFNVSAVVPNVGRGDLNLDGATDGADVSGLLRALTNLSGYQTTKGLTDVDLRFVADLNSDGVINNRDIQALLGLLASGPGSGSGSGGSGSGGSGSGGSGSGSLAEESPPQQIASATTTPVPVVASPVVAAPPPSSTPSVTTSVSTVLANSVTTTNSGTPLFNRLSDQLHFVPQIVGPSKTPRIFQAATTLRPSTPATIVDQAAAVDNTIAEWSMMRSRFLRWGPSPKTEDTEEFFAKLS
jgi:hypothetical protein